MIYKKYLSMIKVGIFNRYLSKLEINQSRLYKINMWRLNKAKREKEKIRVPWQFKPIHPDELYAGGSIKGGICLERKNQTHLKDLTIQ